MEFQTDIFKAFHEQWALLSAGTEQEHNCMTISWGGMGTLWGKPVVTVYVKPVRYTHEFMDKNDYFSVSFFGEEYRNALTLLGTESGRDGDKIAKSGLTLRMTEKAPDYEEAEVTLVCKKIYRQDMDTAFMPENVVRSAYEKEAPHTMYIGEVVEIIKK